MARKRASPRLQPRKRPTQARSRQTYDAILEAAARILARAGYEALTTNHVADLAGVGIASLYEYFPNKQALVAEVVRRTLDDLLADLAASIPLLARPADPRDAIRGWIAAMFAAVHARRALVAVLLREVAFLWEIPAVEQARERLFELARLSRTQRASPPLSEATLYLLTTMTGAAVLEAAIRPPSHVSQGTLISALAEIIDAVTERAPPPRRRARVSAKPKLDRVPSERVTRRSGRS